MADTARGKGQARIGRTSVGAGLLTHGALALLCGILALVIRVVYLLESAGNPFRHHLDLDPKYYHLVRQTLLGCTPLGPAPFYQAPV